MRLKEVSLIIGEVAKKLKDMGRKIRLRATSPQIYQSFKGTIIELEGCEGAQFITLTPCRLVSTRRKTIRNNPPNLGASIHIYCKVIGFKDDKAPIRDWGTMLDEDYRTNE